MALTVDKSKRDEAPIAAPKSVLSDEAVLQARRAIPEDAMRNIDKAGLLTPRRPGEQAPQLPDDIDNLGDKELGFYLGIYARWCEYAEYIVAHADVKHAVASSSHEFISAKVRLGKTGTVQDKTAKTHIDPKYQESLQIMETEFATLRLSKSLLQGYMKMYEALSREITRRQNHLDRGRGNH